MRRRRARRRNPGRRDRADDADLYVEAVYASAPRWLDRAERIVGAWAFV